MSNYKLSSYGLEFIKHHEGYRTKMYKDVAGKPTIGIGHLILPNERHLLTKTITEKEVDALFKKDIKRFEKNLNSVVRTPINQHQVDALLSLMFNIGVAAFNSSSCLKRLNEGKYDYAANNILLWSKARVNGVLTQVRGLVLRRQAERELFLTDPHYIS